LDKLTGSDLDLTFTYNYDSTAGSGTVIYIIGMFLSLTIRPYAPHLLYLTDTGIYTDHPAFGGRASWGKTFGGYKDKDGNGHGTHCAGTAVSDRYGVAKAAKVVAVKVLGDDGKGKYSDM